MRISLIPVSLRRPFRLLFLLWTLASLGGGWVRAADTPEAKLILDASPLEAGVRDRTSLAPIVKRAAPSVVSVYTTKYIRQRSLPSDPFSRLFGLPDAEDEPTRPSGRRRPVEGLGSGVIVTEDGYILTNNHVVDQVDEVKVVLSDGKKEYAAKVVGKDDQTDIAVLKVDAQGLPAITIADSAKLEVGDTVLAIGNPFGVGQTVTSGIVSAVGRSGFYLLRYEDFIQTDASINPGNSGGALVDAQGRLVGVNTLIVSDTGASAGLGFAVPCNLAREVMGKILKHGRVVRGYLGVELELQVTPDLMREFSLPNDQGALVTKVVPGGPADRGGLKPGDFIVEFDGRAVTDRRSLQFHVARTDPKTRAPVKLLRDGKETTVQVNVGELNLTSLAGDPSDPETSPGALEGLETAELTPALRRQFKVPDTVEAGVIVTEVDPDSLAAARDLQAGCVLLEVNRQPVKTPADAVKAAGDSRSGNVLLRVWMPNRTVKYIVLEPQKKPGPPAANE